MASTIGQGAWMKPRRAGSWPGKNDRWRSGEIWLDDFGRGKLDHVHLTIRRITRGRRSPRRET